MLIVGLGNPGADYTKTRHNVGFMAVDAISHRHNFVWHHKSKFNSDIATGKVSLLTDKSTQHLVKEIHEQVILSKPTTFMNLVNDAVTPIASFYKLLAEDILVIHDDLDLPIGKMKYKIGGSAGGHNGLKSLDNGFLGSWHQRKYHRIRIGIGRPEHKNHDVSGYVLGKFTDLERKIIDKEIDFLLDNLGFILAKDFETFKLNLSNASFG